MTQCVVDANVTLGDFETGFQLIDEGLKKIDIKEVVDGLKGMFFLLLSCPSLFLKQDFFVFCEGMKNLEAQMVKR